MLSDLLHEDVCDRTAADDERALRCDQQLSDGSRAAARNEHEDERDDEERHSFSENELRHRSEPAERPHCEAPDDEDVEDPRDVVDGGVTDALPVAVVETIGL